MIKMRLPVIIVNNFGNFSEDETKIMIDDALFSRNEALRFDRDSFKTNTNIIRDRSKNFKKVYEKFVTKSREIFQNVELTAQNSQACHCFCQNNEYWDFNPHIHENCDINAVYYLKVPENSGPIVFTDDIQNGQWEQYQPKEDDLIIFPGDLWHDPLFTSSKEWRISVNMEIQCHNPPRWSQYK